MKIADQEEARHQTWRKPSHDCPDDGCYRYAQSAVALLAAIEYTIEWGERYGAPPEMMDLWRMARENATETRNERRPK